MKLSALREIHSTLGRFMAILAIIALGVGFFSGVKITTPAMVHTVGGFMNDHELFDYRLISTLGWEEEDAEKFRQQPGVVSAEGAYSLDVLFTKENDHERVMKVHSLTENVNKLEILEGRLPEAADECVADAKMGGMPPVGSVIRVAQSNEEETKDRLRYKEFKVVGAAYSPYYVNFERGTTSIGTGSIDGFVYVDKEAFDMEVYSEIYVKLDHEYQVYSDEYKDFMDSENDTWEELVKDQAVERYERVVSDAEKEISDGREELEEKRADGQKELDDARKELEDARTELDDAKKELDDARQEITDGETKLGDAKEEIDKNEKKLNEAKTELDSAKAQIDSGRYQLDSAKAQLNSAQAQVSSGKKELDAAKTQLDASKAQIDESEKAIAEGEEQLAAGQAQIESAFAQIDASSALLAGQESELAAREQEFAAQTAELMPIFDMLPPEQQQSITDTQAQLNAARQQLEGAKAELEQGRAQAEAGKAELEAKAAELEEGKAQLQAGKAQYEAGLAEYQKGLAEYENGKKQYESGLYTYSASEQKYYSGLNEYNSGKREYENGLSQLTEGKAEYEKSLKEFEDGRKEYEDGLAEYEDGEKKYQEGLAEYEDGKAEFGEKIADAEKELADAEQKLADLKEPDTFLLDRSTNIGYACFENDSEIVEQVARVFPIFFILVAALVCMTTMSRMVEEQRTQIGIFKALGYSEWAIMGKFLFYSGSAAMIGCVTGYAVGVVLFPGVIWMTYKLMYVSLDIQYIFDWKLAIIAVAVSMLCSVGTTFVSCRYELSETAASLMRPKAPKAGKRVLLERIPFIWNRMKFLYKVSVRNIFRYKKRFFMMIVGISGCTALLLTGFGLKDSVAGFADVQYEEIVKTDASLIFTPEGGGLPKDLERDINSLTASHKLIKESSWDLVKKDKVKSITLIAPEDYEGMEKYITLRTVDGAKLSPPAAGEAIVSQSINERYGVKTGDEILLRDGDMNVLKVKVAGVCENHVYNYIFTNAGTFEEQLGEKAGFNTVYMNFPRGADHSQTAAELQKNESVNNVTLFKEVKERMTNSMSSLDYVVLLVIASAAGLAFIVLYNLTNINITERIREIATIKVLGFYRRETSAYVLRENIALTAIGAVAGLFLGVLLHRFVMAQIVVDMVAFRVRILPKSFVFSIVLTFVFNFAVNLFMETKLEKINMAESLKSVE